MTTVVRSSCRSTVSTLSRLIKTGVGDLSGPTCLPQSDQVAIASLPSVPKLGDSSTRALGRGRLAPLSLASAHALPEDVSRALLHPSTCRDASSPCRYRPDVSAARDPKPTFQAQAGWRLVEVNLLAEFGPALTVELGLSRVRRRRKLGGGLSVLAGRLPQRQGCHQVGRPYHWAFDRQSK